MYNFLLHVKNKRVKTKLQIKAGKNMHYKETKQSRFVRFLSGKGFYTVLAVCMLAIGVAGYIAVANLNTTEPSIDNSIQVPSYPNNEISGIDVGEISSNVTVDNSAESQPYESEPENQPEQNVATYFIMPITGEIIKDFSTTQLQYSNTFGDMRIHTGVDIVPNAGTVVKSAGNGKVSEITDTADYGTVIKIDHGNGIVIKYCGIKNVTVSAGTAVLAGQALGEIDTIPCECVDEAHLHLEAYNNGNAVSVIELIQSSAQ